jgi:ParB family transcriptional regulator, chromosome partitioning protein
MNIIHSYKVLTEYYQAIVDEKKTFEIRKDDRGLKPDSRDLLRLIESINGEIVSESRSMYVIVTYVLSSEEFEGIAPGYFVMGIKKMTRPQIQALRILGSSSYGTRYYEFSNT